MNYVGISNTVSRGKFSNGREFFIAKQKNEWKQYDYFFCSECFICKPKILQYNCLEGHSVWESDCYFFCQNREMYLTFSWCWLVHQNFPKFLVTLATLSIAILSPVIMATQRYIRKSSVIRKSNFICKWYGHMLQQQQKNGWTECPIKLVILSNIDKFWLAIVRWPTVICSPDFLTHKVCSKNRFHHTHPNTRYRHLVLWTSDLVSPTSRFLKPIFLSLRGSRKWNSTVILCKKRNLLA